MMRDRYLRLLARLRRHRPSNPEPETDRIPAALEQQIRKRFPRPVVSEALRTRVAGICDEAVTAAPADRGQRVQSRRNWLSTARWALLGLAAALLSVVWTNHRPGSEALAATIRAMEAVPVIHEVSRGDKGSYGEIWLVDGVGAYIHSVGRDSEHLMVDDLTYQYSSLLPRRRDRGVPEPRVEIWPSRMADPKQKEEIWNWNMGAGILKALQSEKKSGNAQLSWVTQQGRRMRRIHLPDPYGGTTFYCDPATDRVLSYETPGPDVLTDPERVRGELDYPSLESVDRKRFRFSVPDGVSVWDLTAGPPSWTRGAAATCATRMKTLREALRRYANDHGGQWPASLRPALDPYVPSPEVFYCPLASPEATGMSYEYHPPSELLAAQALEVWNRNKANPAAPPKVRVQEVRLQGARPAILECHRHQGPVFSLYADGNLYRWYPQPTAPAPPVATGPATVDPRALPVLKALAEREQRLEEVKVVYDYRTTHLAPREVPAIGSRPSGAKTLGTGDSSYARVTWARKGKKMLRDETTRLLGRLYRQRTVTDGETVLLQDSDRPDRPLRAPTALLDARGQVGGAADLGLTFLVWSFTELGNGPWGVRSLGPRIIDREPCVGLEVTHPEEVRGRLWFDASHGYMLRRAEQYAKGRLWRELVASQPRQWAPGLFLATRVEQLGYLAPEGGSTAATHRWTTTVREVVVGGLPDALFQPEQ
jgi:hypothetical protein